MPHLFLWCGEDSKKGSAIPESYKLVLPFGNGIPLSDVYRMRVSSKTPASSNSDRTNPIPV